ncbi:1-acyl-SN-glycerol-3-phosphate acyltransferase [Mycoplasmopsis californica]|uniref:lysophospholipid acyltransferase family protein n=1 Tax=Mycoplasmopsis californica TaxID=2113 RepID=UPI000EB719AD|nr:lysophospholipid acyltransferase family protein [Mycoplasmopsis californica]BBG40687.1 1-acyl-SN-glycerol-3-phosphate acyltransferase [Mycoplasmopsis californica]BBG41282.1 1-acyl-SN-glycerol-3-phosphate acyltransferase [Mycoplasmopsis californica]BBG41875.1 1-acyl-SN-glycerol-3-phosphate acyltransferase [Mycoplasmopsis californica]
MGFNLKMIFLWWHFLWCMWRLSAASKRYRRDPMNFHIQQRNDYLLKRAKQLLWYFNVKLEVVGLDSLPKGPVILMPNHKSNIDPLLILASLEKTNFERIGKNKIPTFIAKVELKKRGITRKALELLDTIVINRQDLRQSIKSLEEFGSHVKQNKTYGVIFPEGTRINELTLGEFKAGGAKVARSHYLPIVPVAISDSRDALNKKRNKKLKIRVEFLKVIKPAEFITIDNAVIMERVKQTIEKALNHE